MEASVMKKRISIILSALFVLILCMVGCNKQPVSDSQYYDFTKQVYDYYSKLGYDDTFITALTCVLLTESNGQPTTIEFSHNFPEESAAFLNNSANVTSYDELSELYHNYGNLVYESNVANVGMYRNSEGEFCVGLGILLWTGNMGNDLLRYACDNNYQWTDIECQFAFMDTQLTHAGITPENITTKTSEDTLIKFANDFLGVPNPSIHLDQYKTYLPEVESIVSSF